MIERVDAKNFEIQADDVEEISKKSSILAVQKECCPIFVEDTGLFIEALKGFPGPYASYTNKTIGRAGVLRLMNGIENRRAEFKSAVSFCNPKEEPICFVGTISGRISNNERGTHGFGFDSIFEPNCSDKTFAEMTSDEKSIISHRAQSVKKFANWYLRHFKIL